MALRAGDAEDAVKGDLPTSRAGFMADAAPKAACTVAAVAHCDSAGIVRGRMRVWSNAHLRATHRSAAQR